MVIEIRKNAPPKPSVKKATNPLWQQKAIETPASEEETLAQLKQVADNRTAENFHGYPYGEWVKEESYAPSATQEEFAREVEMAILQKHKERLAYNAAYQRDLRTIKRQGLNMTVAQYRESLK